MIASLCSWDTPREPHLFHLVWLVGCSWRHPSRTSLVPPGLVSWLQLRHPLRTSLISSSVLSSLQLEASLKSLTCIASLFSLRPHDGGHLWLTDAGDGWSSSSAWVSWRDDQWCQTVPSMSLSKSSISLSNSLQARQSKHFHHIHSSISDDSRYSVCRLTAGDHFLKDMEGILSHVRPCEMSEEIILHHANNNSRHYSSTELQVFNQQSLVFDSSV